MREIKFRAWDKSTLRMVNWHDKVFIHDHASDIRLCEYPLKNIQGSYLRYMQYTGLKDKNGVDIYEGDICNFHCDEGSCGRGPVIYQDNAFVIRTGERSYWGSIDSAPHNEIIGNIYENPELLTKDVNVT